MKVFSINNVYVFFDGKAVAKEKCITLFEKSFYFNMKLSQKEADDISAALKNGQKVKTKPFLPNRKVVLPKFQPQHGGKSLAFIRTHYLNENLVKEYIKIEKAGMDCVFLLDNTNNILPDNGDDIQSVELYGHKVKYIPSVAQDYYDLGLKLYYDNKNEIDFKKSMWALGDVAYYLVRKILPDYDYYWYVEYDCFFNGDNYSPLFDKYRKDTADLIIPYFNHPQKSWFPYVDASWLYSFEKCMSSFFPIHRFSARAIDFLLDKRIEVEQKFEQEVSPQGKCSPLCEVFVATELYHNGYECKKLRPHRVQLEPMSLTEVVKKDVVYHPIKGKADPDLQKYMKAI